MKVTTITLSKTEFEERDGKLYHKELSRKTKTVKAKKEIKRIGKINKKVRRKKA